MTSNKPTTFTELLGLAAAPYVVNAAAASAHYGSGLLAVLDAMVCSLTDGEVSALLGELEPPDVLAVVSPAVEVLDWLLHQAVGRRGPPVLSVPDAGDLLVEVLP